jgi:hypothetical protein
MHPRRAGISVSLVPSNKFRLKLRVKHLANCCVTASLGDPRRNRTSDGGIPRYVMSSCELVEFAQQLFVDINVDIQGKPPA